MVVNNFNIVGIAILPKEAIRHCSLIRILHDQYDTFNDSTDCLVEHVSHQEPRKHEAAEVWSVSLPEYQQKNAYR
jgi:hypothetical protein